MINKDYSNDDYQYAIAVVGMAGTFCDAPTLDHLWTNLKEGREAVRFLDTATLRANGCPESILGHPLFVPATAMMADVDRFDANFFGFTPAEARLMDPQLRLMLQTAWHAFENANIIPDRQDGLTGVFAGAHKSDYLLCNMGPEHSIHIGMQALTASLFNAQDYLSTWISYKLGLTGPSINVHSACSTGLVAVATACQNLLDYSCDTALAVTGAVFSPRNWGYLAETGSILSPDGHCRPFDAAARGTITGEGVGAVVLKRLFDALESNDSVLGIIRGYAINNDGALRAGYTAPSVSGQQELLNQALASSGMVSSDITYMEGHGTGTNLGDPIEFKALQSVFGQEARSIPCFLGSIKANLGHLGACAGMVGLQKILLMLSHGVIVPQINFSNPNPELGMEGSAFQVCTELRHWPDDCPRTAAVSSFGLGGTNCHMIVEGFDAGKAALPEPAHSLLPICLSARSEGALDRLCTAWGDFLSPDAQAKINHAATSALAGRPPMPWRVSLAATSAEEAVQGLKIAPKGLFIPPDLQDRSIALFFQDPAGMDLALGKELFQCAESFQLAFSACSEQSKAMHGPDLEAMLQQVPDLAPGPVNHGGKDLLGFATAFGIAHLLAADGVRPRMVAGHGAGNLIASVLAGAMPLEEALRQLCSNLTPSSQVADITLWKLKNVSMVAAPKEMDGNPEATLRQCMDSGAGILLVVGTPHPSLHPRGSAREQGGPTWISLGSTSKGSHSTRQEPAKAYSETLAALFLAGVNLVPRRHGALVRIPLYPFERGSYWAEKGRNFCDMLHSQYKPAGTALASTTVLDASFTSDGNDNSTEMTVEQCMCNIWNKALGTDHITPDDDFFAKGGTSLSAIAIVSDIRKHTGLTIQLRELMHLRTINGVIHRLAQLAEEEAR